MFLPGKILEEKLLHLLAEDLGQGDITTSLIVPADTTAEAKIVSKERGVVAGIEETTVLLKSLRLNIEASVVDGQNIGSGDVLMKIAGDARTILSAERTVLNLLSRMSGIATATEQLIQRLQNAKVKTRVACTRKTAAGLLYFDKKAVVVGGGDSHRLHLDDLVLIKDNHVLVAGSVKTAVKKARQHASLSKKIEVEVTRANDVLAAALAGADIIMLDNFSPLQIRRAVGMLKKRNLRATVLLEASGGITVEQALEFASTGVDLMSLGELTHSAKALDMSLEITKVKNARLGKTLASK
jgi:nicotinate-nucleotide pyrophosphorylase (carboxylating)